MKSIGKLGRTNGKYAIAARSEGFQITNLSAPLPIEMTLEDFARGELMIISHPGWRRCGGLEIINAYDITIYADAFSDAISCIQKSKGSARRPIRDRMYFLNDLIIKNAYIDFDAIKFFHEELKVESALDFAAERNLPVVLTVPCEQVGASRYCADGSETMNFANYLNGLIINKKSIYVLPTQPQKGVIIGDTSPDWEGSISFASSDEGRTYFGRMMDHRWDKIYFAGGEIKNCLRSTLSYFFKKENLVLIDNFCFESDESNGLEVSRELKEHCKKSLPRLGRSNSELRTRSSLLKILNQSNPIDERWHEYEEVFNVFNEYGIRKDNSQSNPCSQLRVGNFKG